MTTNGDDGNPGTEEEPFRTFQKTIPVFLLFTDSAESDSRSEITIPAVANATINSQYPALR
ncbi:MAG: hypothetical protein ACI9XK_003260 [Granulosicoccus sp.]